MLNRSRIYIWKTKWN